MHPKTGKLGARSAGYDHVFCRVRGTIKKKLLLKYVVFPNPENKYQVPSNPLPAPLSPQGDN